MRERPDVAIEVDDATGEWRVNGLPVILLPRADIAGVQQALAGGPGEAAWLATGRHSARQWCAAEAERTGIGGVALLEHYLESLARRGWGRYELLYCRPEDCGAGIRVHHSPFATAPGARAPACRPLGAWLEGALGWLCGPDHTPIAEERACVAAGDSACEFVVRPSIGND